MTRLYRVLLYLYPAEFRRRYAEEMMELAQHHRRRPALLVRDLLSGLAAAHVHAWKHRGAPPPAKEIFGTSFKDLAFAFRNLAKAPAFTLIAVTTIALGIGATTAIFSVVYGIVLEPLPYHEADRLVTVWSHYPRVDGQRGSVSQPDLDDIQEHIGTFDAVAGYASSGFTLTGLGVAEVVPGALATEGLLEVFGESPRLGRDLRRDENVPNGPRVVVVGHGFWQERFGGREDVLGDTITLDGEPYEIVGIAPRASISRPVPSSGDRATSTPKAAVADAIRSEPSRASAPTRTQCKQAKSCGCWQRGCSKSTRIRTPRRSSSR